MSEQSVAVTTANDDEKKFLSFEVGGESYAMEIDRIKEIIEFGSVTRVPMVPAYIRGVTNLRGSVIPVVDLGVRLGRSQGAGGKRACIVLVEVTMGGESMDIGVVVDGVNSVLDIRAAEIEPAPEFGASIPSDFIAGMGKVDGRFLVLLDTERTLSIDDLSAFSSAAALAAIA